MEIWHYVYAETSLLKQDCSQLLRKFMDQISTGKDDCLSILSLCASTSLHLFVPNVT
jgi:hypothetical protein